MKYLMFISVTLLLINPVLSISQTTSEQIQVPFKFALGKSVYERHCGSCHGNDGFGVEKKGPPLMHKYYEPSHHGDASFFNAVKKGVKQHHWKFGRMEPIPEISDRSIGKVIPYVRWLQRQHGIH